MDVRAAVALTAGQPLQITTVQLEGPREGEVLVRKSKPPASVTPMSSRCRAPDPGRIIPGHPRHEGAGRRGRYRPWRDQRQARATMSSPVHAGMPAMPSCLSRKTNLCTAIRATQDRA